MRLICIGCRRNFDNRRAYGGHRTRCPEYQALQQGTLSAPVSTHLDPTVPKFHDSMANIDYEPQMSSFLQDKASSLSEPVRTDAPLTIKLPPVCVSIIIAVFLAILIVLVKDS